MVLCGRADPTAWMFMNRKAGLEIQNSYGNFCFSLHLKNPQCSEAQALFSVKFLAQSLKMCAVCTLKQQICCSYLCKLSVSEDLLHSGDLCLVQWRGGTSGEEMSMPALQPSAPHGATSPGQHGCGRNSTECWRRVSSTKYFLLASSIYFNQIQEHCRKASWNRSCPAVMFLQGFGADISIWWADPSLRVYTQRNQELTCRTAPTANFNNS